MKLALAIVLAAVLAGCGANSVATGGSNGTASVRSSADPSSLPNDETSEPAASDAGDSSPRQAKLGESVRIACDGADCMDVVVLKATTAKRYKDSQYSELDDKPAHKGDVFMATQIRYTAVGANADYNVFDWGLYVNDEQVQDTASVSNGPSPELSGDALPKDKKVTGWIVWEVPAKGRIVLSYEPGQNGSIFEVVLRSK